MSEPTYAKRARHLLRGARAEDEAMGKIAA
jgi:hypothetical protein